MTMKCLTSLREDRPDEIIVVDDGSPFSPSSHMLHLYADVIDKYIGLATNGGYSKAVNEGLKHATGDVIAIGNNDLVFKKGWQDALNVILENYDIATCWTSDQKVKLSSSVEVERDAKFGSLFAMRRKVYDRIGGFDEQFRGYFTDLDYRQRALDARFTIGKNLSFVVDHEGKATYKETDPQDDEFFTAMRIFEAKHGWVE